jgi:fructoselysine/glucoselysine PTS system EIIB component
MIKSIRIDDRLIHGQVAFAWTKHLDANCIIVANDSVVHDEFKKMTLNLAKPPGIKLMMLSIEDSITFLNCKESEKYNIFVLIDNASDALQLANGVSSITSITVGGMRMAPGKRMVSQAVAVNDEDVEVFKKLVDSGVEVEVRQIPTEKKKMILSLLK